MVRVTVLALVALVAVGIAGGGEGKKSDAEAIRGT
jgi:hypothetical protein